MMVADFRYISEVFLVAQGLASASSLAHQIVQTFQYLAELLPPQDHYEYGMRGIMAVLRSVEAIRRTQATGREDALVLAAIGQVVGPKLLPQDVELFEGITSDLFPGVQLPQAAMSEPTMLQAVTGSCVQARLQPTPGLVSKTIQLNEMVRTRHGLMAIGPAHGGKTACLTTLAAALPLRNTAKASGSVDMTWLNPKALSTTNIYASFDPLTREWRDGVLAPILRNVAHGISGQWIVFDGPCDSEWIENLNTVLDESKRLCLLNGEVIRLSPLTRLFFECSSLASVSPSTVSRCGVVYIDLRLDWRPLQKSWLANLPTQISVDERSTLDELCDWLLDTCLWYCRRHGKLHGVPLVEAAVSSALFRSISAQLGEWTESADDTSAPSRLLWLQGIFLFAVIWSIGGVLDTSSRAGFDSLLRAMLRREVPDALSAPDAPRPVTPAVLELVPLPEEGTVFDHCLERSTDGYRWQSWWNRAPSPKLQASTADRLFVQTADTVRITHVIRTLVVHGAPVLLFGSAGTGKTAIMRECLGDSTMAVDERPAGLDGFQTIWMRFSIRSSISATQQTIHSHLGKLRRGHWGPAHGGRAVVIVDDLQLPAVQTSSGAQPPVELLRHLMERKGWYDLSDHTFRYLDRIQMVVCVGVVAHEDRVTPRFLRHFNAIAVCEASSRSLEHIFCAIFDGLFGDGRFPAEVQALGSKIVQLSISLHRRVVAALLPTPSKPHYTFTQRDLFRLFSSIVVGRKTTAEVISRRELIRLWAHEALRVFSGMHA